MSAERMQHIATKMKTYTPQSETDLAHFCPVELLKAKQEPAHE